MARGANGVAFSNRRTLTSALLMPPAVIRIAVVDDHQAWRREIATLLRARPGLQIVGEAADGGDAVTLARDTDPDLMLLDVGLPTISGIEAARRILAERPGSRILFVSAYESPDIVEGALLCGARGYLLKPSFKEELPVAIDAVAAGGRFLSAGLGGRPLTRDGQARTPHVHTAAFFSDGDTMLEDYARFAAAALGEGRTLIGCFSSTAQAQELRARVAALRPGVDLDHFIECGRFTTLQVADLLGDMFVDDRIVESRFHERAIPMLLRAAKIASANGAPGISAFGDAARELWEAGRIDAAIRLEQLWDEMARTFNLEVMCGYPMIADAAPPAGLDALRGAHSETVTR
jgi:DNA-binding NarL/FixJ family response regulator